MVVFTKHIPQQEQAVFTSKPLSEVKEISNLGKVQLPEQESRVVIKATQVLKVSKNLVVLAVQQPKHPPVSPHLPPEEVGYIAPMVPPEGTHTVADNPLLESARAYTKAALEQLVKEGDITGFEEWGCLDEEDDLEEGDALYFVAYAKSPMSVRRHLAELSSRLTREHRVPIFIVTFRKDA
jgi:hypothetical protein